jgi:hypothetical protein
MVVLFVMGAVLGYGMLAAGPIVAFLALFVLILLLSRREQLGSYLAGLGLAGFAVLGHIVLTCASPSCHYDMSTPIGMVGFGIVAVAGISLLAWTFRQAALRRRRFPPAP